MFKIGPTDLKGNIQATYKGHSVTLTTLEPNLLTFKYREDNMPITYYVYVIADSVLGYNVLVLSQYSNLLGGDYLICTKANDLYGTWTRNDGAFVVRFDGVTSGAYSYGTAALSRGGASSTAYNYTINNKGVMMWSQVLLGGKTQYFRIDMLDMTTATEEELNAADVYVKKNENGEIVGAFRRIAADGLLFTEATDEAGTTYLFDGGNMNGNVGKLYVNGEVAYTYVVKAYNMDNTANLEITDVKTGKTYRAILDYSKAGAIRLTIGEEI